MPDGGLQQKKMLALGNEPAQMTPAEFDVVLGARIAKNSAW